MASMVYIYSAAGSKIADVACPRCGLISRETLESPYDMKAVCALGTAHVCAVCGAVYESCATSKSGDWFEAYTRYLRDPGEYARSITEAYNIAQSIRSKPAAPAQPQAQPQKPAAPAQPPAQPLEQPKPAPPAGSALEPDERSKALDRRVEYWKNQLLDFGKRNKMINYRETKRATLGILEPGFNELFNRLALGEETLRFQKPLSRDNDLRAHLVLSLMDELGQPIDAYVGDIRPAGSYAEAVKTLKNLRAKSKLARDEQGANILYLCFGFIHWKERGAQNAPWLKSPLLMMPVTLAVESIHAPFTLFRYDDEIEVNPTLDYLFNREYGTDLPAFELKDADSIDEYMLCIERIADERGWKLTREVNLGLVSFLKISMHHDLENNIDQVRKSEIVRAITGDKSAAQRLPEGFKDFDYDRVPPSEWHQVVNSDSSQQEAIMLSKMGVSFVMQGPPGTGKSQTITNMIAEALADGKKVLFVSEKAAALKVVLKRLAGVGLDDFCLALHSHKANKKQILDSIASNIKLERERVKDSVLAELEALNQERDSLNEYANALHAPVPPLGESLYGAFGKLSALEDATPLSFALDSPIDMDAGALNSLAACVKSYERALSRIGGAPDKSQWRYTTLTSSDADTQMRFTRDTAKLFGAAHALAETAGALKERFGSPFELSARGAGSALEYYAPVVNASGIPLKWLDADLRRALYERASDMRALSRARDKGLHEVSRVFAGGVSALKLSQLSSAMYERAGELREIGNLGDMTQDMICLRAEDIRASSGRALERLERVMNDARRAAGVLSAAPPENFTDACEIAASARALSEAIAHGATWLEAPGLDEAVKLCERADEHASRRHFTRAALERNWEPGVFSIDSEAMLKRFKTEHTGLFKRLKSGYRSDVNTMRALSKRAGAKIDDDEIVKLLYNLRSVRVEEQWFSSNARALNECFGARADADSDWAELKRELKCAQLARARFQGGAVPADTIRYLSGDGARGDFARVTEALNPSALNDTWEDIRGFVTHIDRAREASADGVIIPCLKSVFSRADTICEYMSDALAGARPGTLAPEALECMKSARRALRAQDTLSAQNEYNAAAFGGMYAGVDADWDGITGALDTADKLCASDIYARLGEAGISAILADARSVDDLTGLLTALERRLEDIKAPLDAFAGCFAPEADMVNMPLAELSALNARCVNGFEALDRWLDYADARRACAERGLGDFVSRVESTPGGVPDAHDAFLRAFYRQWLDAAIAGAESVARFRRHAHDDRIEEFRALDEKQLVIARGRVREKVIARFPDFSRVTGANDEMSILKHELNKKRRIMPLRKLFREIPNLLMTLKPCLMMSPLSVAYFLEAKSYKFDMVIFDEASQIFPQDAIGAIFRGKQVIIAGDTKQLPPTNFFAASTSNDDSEYDADEDNTGDVVYDSILEEAASVLADCTLLWHYRSKHEHLIAFSNQEIYKNELITFPSSAQREPDTGVEFEFVEDGVYESGGENRNINEAKRVAELVRAHFDAYPERSLGVIAFSEKQQQAITDEINAFRERNDEYERFFTEGGDDEFFVKNLENVQGDERDTIIFSVCYARTAEQIRSGRPMAMRFGPLGHPGGERRLNVAITRAKRNIKLVSSILPTDIDLTRTDAEGIRMLRAYIEFARLGEAALGSGREPRERDEFVDAVCEFIASKGFEADKHVGCSGYKIDIAVRHASRPGRFIAAVECDGLSYASARTARDRDHLRADVLTGMGWNVYRVWSAEWYRNRAIEGERLIKFLSDCADDRRAPEDSNQAPAAPPESIDIMEKVRPAPAAPADNPYGFEYYTPAEWPESSGVLDERDTRRILSGIRYILRAEQPMSRELLNQRMAGAFGRAKVTPAVKRAVDAAIDSRAAQGVIIDRGGFLTLAGFDELRVRVPREGEEQRAIDNISPDEIALAMRVIAARTYGITRDALIDETSRALGYARKGERILSVLTNCADALILSGALVITDGKISAGEDA